LSVATRTIRAVPRPLPSNRSRPPRQGVRVDWPARTVPAVVAR